MSEGRDLNTCSAINFSLLYSIYGSLILTLLLILYIWWHTLYGDNSSKLMHIGTNVCDYFRIHRVSYRGGGWNSPPPPQPQSSLFPPPPPPPHLKILYETLIHVYLSLVPRPCLAFCCLQFVHAWESLGTGLCLSPSTLESCLIQCLYAL